MKTIYNKKNQTSSSFKNLINLYIIIYKYYYKYTSKVNNKNKKKKKKKINTL
jgi:hypothetical protein